MFWYQDNNLTYSLIVFDNFFTIPLIVYFKLKEKLASHTIMTALLYKIFFLFSRLIRSIKRNLADLRGGYDKFWIIYNFQAYSTKFANYYSFVVTWNLWNFQGILWIISWDIQILNKTKKA